MPVTELRVGVNAKGEVIIGAGVGDFIVSPVKAREIASRLLTNAAIADGKKEQEYHIAFYTKDCPEGMLDCVRVRIDMVRGGKEDTFDSGLADDPLYRELQDYVRENPR